MSPFKALKGRRILLNFPERKESVIQLSPEAQEEADKEFIKTLNSLEVFAVGEDVKDIVAGDRIYVQVQALTSGDIIEINGKKKVMIGDYDVVIVW